MSGFDPNQKQREADAAFWAGVRGDHTHKYSPEYMRGAHTAGRDHVTGKLHSDSLKRGSGNAPDDGSGAVSARIFVILLFAFIASCYGVHACNPF